MNEKGRSQKKFLFTDAKLSTERQAKEGFLSKDVGRTTELIKCRSLLGAHPRRFIGSNAGDVDEGVVGGLNADEAGLVKGQERVRETVGPDRFPALIPSGVPVLFDDEIQIDALMALETADRFL